MTNRRVVVCIDGIVDDPAFLISKDPSTPSTSVSAPACRQGVDERMINAHYYYYSGRRAQYLLPYPQFTVRDSAPCLPLPFSCSCPSLTCPCPSLTCPCLSLTCPCPSLTCPCPSLTCLGPSLTCQCPSLTCQCPSMTCRCHVVVTVLMCRGFSLTCRRCPSLTCRCHGSDGSSFQFDVSLSQSDVSSQFNMLSPQKCPSSTT